MKNIILPLLIMFFGTTVSVSQNYDCKNKDYNLIVKDAPSHSGKKIFNVKIGETITIIKTDPDNEHSYIEYDGRKGYVKSLFIDSCIDKEQVAEEIKIKEENAKLQDQKWYSANNFNDYATFSKDFKTLVIFAENKEMILNKKGYNKWEFVDKKISRQGTFQRYTYYTAKLVNSEKTVEIKITQNYWRAGSGTSKRTTLRNEMYVKDLKYQTDQSIQYLSDRNIILRYNHRKGKVGEDYIPAYTESYNAGKKFTIGDVEIQENDWRTYVTDGDYTKDIQGYVTAIQFINKTDKYQLIEYEVSGTSIMSDIVKTFWGFTKYTTKYKYDNFSYNQSIIIKPNSTFKDKVICGIEIPKNFSINVKNSHEVDINWVNNLKTALKGNNLNITKRYLEDPKAKSWYSQLKDNVDKINSTNQEAFNQRYINQVTASFRIKDDVMFDEDFESEIILKFFNSSDKDLKVKYQSSAGEGELNLKSNEKLEITKGIIGFSKDKIKVSILEVREL